VALMALPETGFKFDQVPALAHTDVTAVPTSIPPVNSPSKVNSGTGSHGNADDGASSQKDPGAVDTAAAHGHTADVDSNPGELIAWENGRGDHSGSDAAFHPGSLKAWENGVGNHSNSSDADQPGFPTVHNAVAHNIEPVSIDHAALGSGPLDALGLGDSFHFKEGASSSGGNGV